MPTANIKIAPSILSADFAYLGDAVKAVEGAGAHQIHVDVMDGHFVPNITMGPVVVESVHKITELPLDVHLMVSQPENYVDAFAQAGASALTFHIEAVNNPSALIEKIRGRGLRAGVAVSPGTSLDAIRSLVSGIDIILVMTVEPGFGGQPLLKGSIDRVLQVRTWLTGAGSTADLTADGGINLDNARAVIDAGATVLVAGNSIFRTQLDSGESVKQFLKISVSP